MSTRHCYGSSILALHADHCWFFFPPHFSSFFFSSQQEPSSLSEYASLLSEQYPSFARTPASVGNLKDLMNDGIVKDYDDCKAAAVQARKRDKPDLLALC